MPKEDPRPSREERERLKLVRVLNQRVDRKYRTRSGKRIRAQLIKIDKKDPGTLKKMLKATQKAKPPKRGGSKAVYSGNWRSFEAAFAADWWTRTGFPCPCSVCKKDISQYGKGDQSPTIDHVLPWATVKTTLVTHTVCKQGVHWEVVYTADVREAFQEPTNLRPAHKGCNSKKNGPKDTDSIRPRRVGGCPGKGICKEKKGK